MGKRTKRPARVHQKVRSKGEPQAVGDVWAKERAALVSGRIRAKRGRPKKAVVPPPPELVQAVTGAEGAEALDAAIVRIAKASAAPLSSPEYIEPKVAKVLLDCVKERRQVQMRLKAKEGAGVISGAFELLTKQEREVVEAYRASKRVEPLKPGETPPPPPEDAAK